jgi:hypothetical protein
MAPSQHGVPTYTMGGPPHGSPQVSSTHMYNNFSSSPGMQPPFMAAPPTYGMSRQSSSNSISPYHPHGPPPQHQHQHQHQHMAQHSGPPHLQQMAPQLGSPLLQQHMGHPMQAKAAMGSTGHQQHGPPQGFTSLPNYGNPASLPQKPPSGI